LAAIYGLRLVLCYASADRLFPSSTSHVARSFVVISFLGQVSCVIEVWRYVTEALKCVLSWA